MSSAEKLAKLKIGYNKPDKSGAIKLNNSFRRVDRASLVQKGIQLPKESVKQFELLRAELGCKGYELWTEAVDLLIEKHSNNDD